MPAQQKPEEITLQGIKEKLDNFVDLENRVLTAVSGTGKLLFIKSITDPQIINRSIIAAFYEMNDPAAFAEYLAHYPGSKAVEDGKQAMDLMLAGYACVEVAGRLIFFDALKAETSSVSQTVTESITQGPSDALTENLAVNLNLIRRRYQSAELKMESLLLGNISRTKVAILYDDSRVNHQVLDELRERLKTLRVDIVQAAGEVEKYISSDKIRIFPKTIVTERPDRVVFNLAEGKIAIMLDTTGFAIVLPVIFNDFFVAMDDKIQLPFVGRFLKLLRIMGVAMTLWLPALYVVFTSYNPEIIRVQIALLIAGSRATVPYPSFVEVLLMLIMMEFLTEASLRLPRAIGPTATTVGGLILGQAATAAGLVGNIMIILVSVVAISNFMIPLNMMSFSIRVLKYLFVVAAAAVGLVGVVVCLVGFTMYLCSQRSFGQPYFKMFVLDSLEASRSKKGGGS
ncbi:MULTISPECIES: spore germination protein [unclassified Paenibacillus]|uniref:spore germination protein n=1 Tax=unclassified Paenibacillus TaxID=185978 RepID=UPI002405D092|nr:MULTISPECIES: spore germination protein [unclassified Paenibacillus]MDF9840034.1 spore germination protein KA [Paenibacillus sp. PastF-2]MDF9846616.1 spore germination protein KA [Paenibacillus sp. PastM-2]MDF9853036.1 spore germination protein KA [Paenibacillus sp. PastF-1]MDH6478460.1 spore germination protein KA [Paenibacillus sp. PastH-2]MDH6506042.1 spore germination protein KA [Paenibacillus sp. PastM-3]